MQCFFMVKEEWSEKNPPLQSAFPKSSYQKKKSKEVLTDVSYTGTNLVP
jgi:hypothetical protein